MSAREMLVLGLITSIASMGYVAVKYRIALWKSIIASIFLMIAGVLGSATMFYVETGTWGGSSFFGGVFLLPIMMIPVALILKTPYSDIMDLCGPGGCAVLIVSKIKCAVDGCCYGRILHIFRTEIQFPSQIVESIVGAILMVVLLIMVKKGKNRGEIFAWCLLLYGITRFFLNLLRDTKPWLGPLPAGNVWSLLAIIIGCIFLVLNKRKQKNEITA